MVFIKIVKIIKKNNIEDNNNNDLSINKLIENFKNIENKNKEKKKIQTKIIKKKQLLNLKNLLKLKFESKINNNNINLKINIKGRNNKIVEDIINNRKGKVNLKYFSPNKKENNKTSFGKIIVNKINIKELSKLSDRPILGDIKNFKEKKDMSSDNTFPMMNNNRLLNFENSSNNFDYLENNKNMVIFTERPKKLSDYILKNNNKKKLYQLTYLDENDINFLKHYNENLYKDYNSNRDYNGKYLNKNKTLFHHNTYDEQEQLFRDLYNKNYSFNYNINSSINNIRKNNYYANNIYTNNQNNDQLKVIKIQSVWRGHQIRKFMIMSLNNFYNILKLYNVLYKIFYNNSKPTFKDFFNLLLKVKTDLKNNTKKMLKNKKINRYITNIKSFNDNFSKNITNTKSFNDNINNNKLYKENIKKMPIIDKKNINFFIPGEHKNNNVPKNNFVYKGKNNLAMKSPLLTKKNLNLNKKENNIILRGKTKDFGINKNINIYNKNNIRVNNIVKYIIKKNGLLHFPLLLYRLRILQKLKLIELKYKGLFNIFRIKEKLSLYSYFNRYRNNIFSQTVNLMFITNQINKNKEKLKNKDNTNNNETTINNNNINKDNININNNTKNNLNNSILAQSNITENKKNELLKKILNKKVYKIKINYLNKYFNKWKKIIIIYNLKKNKYFNKSFLNKSTDFSKKKFIKVRRIKSSNINNITQPKSVINGKALINSFDLDKIKKMKINRIKLESRKCLTNDFMNKISNENVDNIFLQKVSSIFRKISNKNTIFNFFNYWKKKSKENK